MGGELNSSQDLKKLFDEVFPYYLALGMTYELFWQSDPGLVRSYRKAQEIRRDRDNRQAWLQGMYFYEALCDASPILRAFSRQGTKPSPYPDRPYALTSQQVKEQEEEEEETSIRLHKAYLEEFAKKFNQRFKKGGEQNENRPT